MIKMLTISNMIKELDLFTVTYISCTHTITYYKDKICNFTTFRSKYYGGY